MTTRGVDTAMSLLQHKKPYPHNDLSVRDLCQMASHLQEIWVAAQLALHVDWQQLNELHQLVPVSGRHLVC